MAFTIGRAGRTLPLNDPMSVQFRGGLLATHGLQYLTVKGSAGPLSPASDILRLRDQLLSLDGNVDELIVPVVIDSEPRLTGYYRVIGMQLTVDPAVLAKGWLYYTMDLEQVTGFANPQFEGIITGGLLANAVGAVFSDAQWFHAVPTAATEYFRGVGGSYSTRLTADGSLLVLYGVTSSPSGTAHFYLAPSKFYIGAPTFEQGSPPQPVIGRQLAQADLVNWRLSNGLVRVTPNATPGKLDVSHFCGGASAVGTPNLLSPNDSSFEGGVGSWVNGGNAAVAQSAAQALDGTKSLSFTSLAAGDMAATSGLYPVTPSTQYTALASFRAAVTPRSIRVYINWYDSARVYISTPGGVGTDTTSGWTQATVTAIAPANAAYAVINCQALATGGAGEVHYLDCVALNLGTNTTWQIGGWSLAKTYVFSMPGTFGTVNGFTTVTVLRNSPEETVIRLGCTGSGGPNWGRATIDVSLRRGDRLARCFCQADQTSNWKVARDVAEAATAIAYGAVTVGNIRATANDPDGNRYVLISDQAAVVNDLANGALTESGTPGTMDVGIGSEIGGSGAAGPDRAVDLAQFYLAAQGEKQTTVAR